jgi:hypothetical protein
MKMPDLPARVGPVEFGTLGSMVALVNNEVKMQPGAAVTALWRSNYTHLDLFSTGTDGAVWSIACATRPVSPGKRSIPAKTMARMPHLGPRRPKLPVYARQRAGTAIVRRFRL